MASPINQTLNDLSKLTLIASDAAYFTAAHPVPPGSELFPLDDTSYGLTVPRYDFSAAVGFKEDTQFPDDGTGFKFIAFRNEETNEVIVAFGGTDGRDPKDWKHNTNLGWDQWNSGSDPFRSGRDAVFNYLNGLENPGGGAFTGKIHFTGQSLGGALAQYAAYEYVRNKLNARPGEPDFDPNFDKQNVTLTTFNGLGGLKILQTREPGGYQESVLAGLGAVAHYYISNDVISRLGGGHVGGPEYLLNFTQPVTHSQGFLNPIDPQTGLPYLLDMVAAHRIETGFYANLVPGEEFMVARPEPVPLLAVDSLQEVAALFGNVLNNKDLTQVTAALHLIAAVTSALTFADAADVDTLVQVYLKSKHDDGSMGDIRYSIESQLPWADISFFLRGVTLPLSAVTLVAANFADAIHAVGGAFTTVFQGLSGFLDMPVPPPVEVPTSDRQLQMQDIALVAHSADRRADLAALGITPDQFAEKLLSGTNWLDDTLNFFRDKSETDPTLIISGARLASGMLDAAKEVHDFSLPILSAKLDVFALNTAKDIGNLSQLLSFSQYKAYEQAYSALLLDDSIDPSLDEAIKDGKTIIDAAGEEVVLISGHSMTNPFDAPGVNPDEIPLPSGTVREGFSQIYTAFIPYAAGPDGQRIQFTINGGGGGTFLVADAVQEQTLQSGVFTITIPEGVREAIFSLWAKDLSSDGNISLSATLLDSADIPTHAPKPEATLTLLDTPPVEFDNGSDSRTQFLRIDHYESDAQGNPIPIYEPLFDEKSNSSLNAAPALDGRNNITGTGNGNDYVLSAGGNDILSGDQGNDTLFGAGGNDRLFGGEGDDIVNGGVDDDRLEGDKGDDTLMGGGGNDSLIGGAGDDIFEGDDRNGIEHSGDDVLQGDDGNDSMYGIAGNDVLTGGAGDDYMWGDYLANVTVGGNDTLYGGDGRDGLFGGVGGDVLYGGAGPDLLEGDVPHENTPAGVTIIGGNDFLAGGEGDDELVGGVGDDVLFGQAGDDLVVGDDPLVSPSAVVGNDFLDGGAGDDRLWANLGDDVLVGGAGNDILEGDNVVMDFFPPSSSDLTNFISPVGGNDKLFGGDGNDFLMGDAGNDTLEGGSGVDVLLGDDVFLNSPSSGQLAFTPGLSVGNDILDGGKESDKLYGGGGGDVLDGGDGNDFLMGDDFVAIIPALGPFDNITLSAFVFDAIRSSSPGNDTLVGGAGNDILFGAGGADTLRGGSGSDYLFGDEFDDNVSGNDTIDGGDGDDGLYGSGGDDVLLGGAGVDYMEGGDGDDRLEGGDGNDTLLGGAGNNVLQGGAGNDDLFGGDGDDIFDGGAGNDFILGGNGRDTYVFGRGSGTDLVVNSGGGDDVVRMTAEVAPEDVTVRRQGGDLVLGIAGTPDQLTVQSHFNSALTQVSAIQFSDGTTWDNSVITQHLLFGTGVPRTLVGFSGQNNRLQGSSTNEILMGLAGNDVLGGGGGRDALYGASGNDTYQFGRGSGSDTIFDRAGVADAIQIGEGIAPGDVRVLRAGNNLVLDFNNTSDRLTVQYFFVDPSLQMESVRFVDGTVWDAATLQTMAQTIAEESVGVENDNGLPGGPNNGGPPIEVAPAEEPPQTIVGTGASEVLYGSAGRDIFDSGAGNDRLRGFGGNDTYLFGPGSGQDLVIDFDQTLVNVDTIQMAANLMPDDITVTRSGDDVVLSISGTTDQLAVQSFFTDSASQVERVQFGDGTTWDAGVLTDKTLRLQRGGPGNDVLNGPQGSNDLLDGGEGDDVLKGDNLTGYPGDDKLLGGLGNDHLFGFEGRDFLDGGPGDDVLQGDGDPVGQQFPTPTRVNDNDTLLGGDGNDVLSGTSGDDFLDGGDGDDVLSGDGGSGYVNAFFQPVAPPNPGNDILLGGAGNDRLDGGEGDDLLDGGPGNDGLVGGPGNDTYIFGRGYGHDTIRQTGDDGSIDTLRLLDFLPSDVTFSRVSDPFNTPGSTPLDLLLTINGTTDQLTVEGFFQAPFAIDPPYQIQQIAFADGTVWDVDTLRAQGIFAITGTAGADVLKAYERDDTVVGLGGNDTLDDSGLVVTLRGGAGDDLYRVTDGVVRIVEAVGEGTDTVQSSVNYVLSTNVENLTLLDSFLPGLDPELQPILGIGNAFDNVLIGNRAGNVLDGGAGNDTLNGGAGNDTLIGGRGDDSLFGGPESDTYLFNLGDGVDTIGDLSGSIDTNRILFGDGITAADLIFTRDQDRLTIAYGSSGDAVHLADFDPSNVSGSVMTVQFSNGSSVSLADLVHAPTVANPITDQSTAENAPFSFQVPASTFADDDAGDTLAYRVLRVGGQPLPAWLRFDTATRTFVGTPDDADVGTIRLSVTATDMDNLSVSNIFALTVTNVNEAPTVANPLTDQSAKTDVLVSFVVPANTFSDPDTGDTLTYSATLENGMPLPAWLVFNPATRLFSGMPDDLDTGTMSLKVTATDTGHLSASDHFNLTVTSNPVIMGTSGDDVITTGAGDDVTDALAGNDRVDAGPGHDTITGGPGNDTLSGGVGNDTYVFNVGDGRDLIEDLAGADGGNTIRFGSGITLSAVHLSFVESTLVMAIGTGSDAISLTNFNPNNAYGPHAIGTFLFADGSSLSYSQVIDRGFDLSGTTGDDTISGTSAPDRLHGLAGNDVLQGGGGNDVLNGGVGNDRLQGGAGSDILDGGADDDSLEGGLGSDFLNGNWGRDTYLFNLGDGADRIDEAFGLPAGNTAPTPENTLRFGPGIRLDDLNFFFGPTINPPGGSSLPVRRSYLIQMASQPSDSILVAGGPEQTIEFPHLLDHQPLQTLEFADGLQVDTSAVFPFLFPVQGTNATEVITTGASNDVIRALDGNDTVNAGAGTDTVFAGSGDDVIQGGPGNDVLLGQGGNDTYVFNLGDGVDQIVDTAASGEGNRLQFGPSIALADLSVTQDQNTLTIHVGTAGDAIRLMNFDPNGVHGSLVVETLQFSNEGSVNLADLLVPVSVNRPPTVANSIANLSIAEDSVFSFIVPANTFADPDAGDTLTYSASLTNGAALPAWLSFNATTRSFSGAPVNDDVGTVSVQVTATDTGAFSTSDSFALAVTNVNDRPTVVHVMADQNTLEDAGFSFQLPANMFADVDTGDVLTYEAMLGDGLALPAWLSFDAVMLRFTGTPNNGDVGSGNITVRARDTVGLFAVDTFVLSVSNVNDAPTVAHVIADQTTAQDALFSLVVPANTFADPDAGDPLTYGASLASGASLPTWLNFNTTTRTFSGTPGNGDIGGLSLKVTATDTGSLSVSDTFGLTVTNVNHGPVVANPIIDQTRAEDAPFTFQVAANTFADPDAGDTLTYSASLATGASLPAWLSFNAATRTFSGTADDAQVGTIGLKVTATDSGNLSAGSTFALMIANVNEAPTVAHAIADQSTAANAPFNLMVPANAFTDVDSGDMLTYSALLADGSDLPTWLSFNTNTATFSGTPQNTDQGTINVKVTATDTGNSSAADIFGLTVTNVTALPALALSYDGMLRDNIGQDNGARTADGRLDGAFTLTLASGSGNRTITSLDLRNSVGGIWDSFATSPYWTLGVASGLDGLLLQSGSDSVNVALGDGGSVSLFASDWNNSEFVPGTSFTVIAGFGDGTSASATTTVGSLPPPPALALSYDGMLRDNVGQDNGARTADGRLDGAFTLTLASGSGNRTITSLDLRNSVGGIWDSFTTSPYWTLGVASGLDGLLLQSGSDSVNVALGDGGSVSLFASDWNNSEFVPGTSFTVVASFGDGTSASAIATIGGNHLPTSTDGDDVLNLGPDDDVVDAGGGNDIVNGGAGSDTLSGGTGSDLLDAGPGDDLLQASTDGIFGWDLVAYNAGSPGHPGTGQISSINGKHRSFDVLRGGEGQDTLAGSSGDDALFLDDLYSPFPQESGPRLDGIELIATGDGDDIVDLTSFDFDYEDVILDGGNGNDVLWASGGNDVLIGGKGNDSQVGGAGNDTYRFNRGDGQDTIIDQDATAGNSDTVAFGTGITPLDLILSRQVDNLRIAIHGSSDQVTIQNWYGGSDNQVETIQAGNGQHLINTQVNQLIQAMASFGVQTGLSWEQAIDQRPQDVQTILAASWQS